MTEDPAPTTEDDAESGDDPAPESGDGPDEVESVRDQDPETASDADETGSDSEAPATDRDDAASDRDDAAEAVAEETPPAADARADPPADASVAEAPDADETDPSAEGPSADDDAADAADEEPAAGGTEDETPGAEDVPEDVRKYERFQKIEGGTYERANEFLRERTYITAREWAIARLCADFRTETGVEMTKIGENLPELVPFMTDTYSPQAVNQARAAFEEKVQKAGATFLYGAMCDFFTAEELDDVMYEATEVAKFLLEVEGVELSVEEELAAEDRISEVMREVRDHSAALRHDECPHCGGDLDAAADD